MRSAQRWEKSAHLPIHRDGSSHPVAFTDELDLWLDSGLRPHGRLAWKAVRGSLLWMLLASLLLLFHASSDRLDPATVSIVAGAIQARSAGGGLLWERPLFPGGSQGDGWEWENNAWDESLLEDVDQDGRNEVLVNGFPSPDKPSRGALVCFDDDGTLLWRFPYGRALRYRGREFSDVYGGHFVRMVSGRARRYLLTVAVHECWYPAQVALLDPASGRLLQEYWHPGGFSHILVRDLDGDGADEVLLAGINNPGTGLGRAALVQLSIPFSRATGDGYLGDIGNGAADRYLLFPRPDISTVYGQLLLVTKLSLLTGNRIRLHLLTSHGGADVVYILDRNLESLQARLSDNVISFHRNLQQIGLLDHSLTRGEQRCLSRVLRLSAAPDGNAPQSLWAGCQLAVARQPAPTPSGQGPALPPPRPATPNNPPGRR